MKKYDHKKIEKKWQEEWEKSGIYKTEENSKKDKCYVLDMFPYPSGDGLHVGHPKGYIATDIYSRFKKMNGFNVLHPMGWDAFGLPAENYAIKNKIHPKIAVDKNIKIFKKQLEKIGFSYDWSREINTTDPKYYKWTQWIFLQLHKKGLAYESCEPINWCPSCKTGLANEDLDGDKCERCDTVIEKKPMKQWVLKITDYADRLIDDLEELNWPESIKELQRNWIGRSEGVEIEFRIKNYESRIKIFTTRPDTLFGATYCVLAPEHELILNLKSQISNLNEVEKYIKEVQKKTEIERTGEGKEKTGVELKGVKAVNPANKEEIPIFIADYVLAHYGTGAIMAVPAHDQRDFEFATKYKLPIKMVICPNYPKPICPVLDKAYEGKGKLVDSGELIGMDNEEAKKAVAKLVGGKMKTAYKLRDWVFSRQRYWGEPIPIIHCEKCALSDPAGQGVVPVPEKDLPVELPEVELYEPTETGESPLAKIDDWMNVDCPKCGGKAKREANTMPQWAGSSWYYLRYIDPQNDTVLVDKKKEKYWSPVDIYIGGTEHAARHLIYARFWHKFLYDIGVVNYKEPFKQYRYQGLINAKDGRKMSKRWGNVINPDEIVENYGADSLRLYEMFMGPFDQAISWNTKNIIGIRRFLEKVWKLRESVTSNQKPVTSNKLELLLHKTIKKVTEDIENFKFNTAISQLMILANEMEKEQKLPVISYRLLITLFAPFAPHITEELWSRMGNKAKPNSANLVALGRPHGLARSAEGGFRDSIHLQEWPKYDTVKIKEKIYNLAVQINGKLRDSFEAEIGISKEKARELTLNRKNVKKWVGIKSIKKVIFIKNRLINIVI